MIQAVVGASWGDEGKGKITDLLAAEADAVVRFQGGAGDGHTVTGEHGRFSLQLMPAGAFRAKALNIIGAGVALYVPTLMKEVAELKTRGLPPRLMVSDRVQIVMPYHIDLDSYEQERLTGRVTAVPRGGLSAFYADHAARLGFQVCELYGSADALREKLDRVCAVKNTLLEHLYHKPPIDREAMLELMIAWREQLRPFIGNACQALRNILAGGGRVLMEGQLGALRDPDNGIYPHSASSSPLAGYAAVGAGVGVTQITSVVAVARAHACFFGTGPLVTELTEDPFKDEAAEFSVSRPRRAGWFDAVAIRYGAQLQGATELALTHLDALDTLPEISVCVAYEHQGQRMEEFPCTPVLEECVPVLEALPGWGRDLRGITEWEELPENARAYVRYIERACGVPVTMVSTGPGRGDVIRVPAADAAQSCAE